MPSDTPDRDATQARERAIFRKIVGCGLVLALAFGILNTSGLFHI